MGYCKIEHDGYLVGLAEVPGKNNVSEEEYEKITAIIQTRPTPEPGHAYRLKTDLSWELYEMPVQEEPEDLTAEEALGIIVGGDGE